MRKILRVALLAGILTSWSCQKGGDITASNEPSGETPTQSQTSSPTSEGAQASAIVGEPPFPIADSSKIVTTPSGLRYYIVQQGTGNKPKPGQKVIAMYHGLLANGDKFDSSYDRRQPFEFTLGQGQVIKGWDEGFQYLSVGTKAILIIPPDLGYGAQSTGNIPPNSTLYFHVELLNITG
jgi:peptidylprolyl isomerase